MEALQINHFSIDQHVTFSQWVFRSRERVSLLCLSAIIVVGEFYIFKKLYPFPSFLPDSYFYIGAAFNNQPINIWPIGYSKFLRLFSSFTHSHYALIFFQFFFLQSSITYLMLSCAYIFKRNIWTTRLLIMVNILNPIILYLSNLVSSDAIFTGLSLIWFTQLIWMFFIPSLRLYFFHAVILMITFSMRYNALYYPIITFTVILLSRSTIQIKTLAITMVILLTGIFIGNTMFEFKKITGKAQFSPFGGWQLASNALIAFSRNPSVETAPTPKEFQSLQNLIVHHNDSISKIKVRPDSVPGIYYLWEEHAPLKRFMNSKFKGDTTTIYLTRWSSVAPLFKDYGYYYMTQHPINFLYHFIVPNLRNYYVPPAEFLSAYNMGSDSVDMSAKVWFGLKSQKISSYLKDKKIKITRQYSVIVAIINTLFLLSIIGTILLNGSRSLSIIMWMVALIWVFNFLFSVLASSIVLRYQIFSTILALSSLFILIPDILNKGKSGEEKIDQFH